MQKKFQLHEPIFYSKINTFFSMETSWFSIGLTNQQKIIFTCLARTLGTVLRTHLKRWPIGKDGKRESKESMQSVYLDDDDDDDKKENEVEEANRWFKKGLWKSSCWRGCFVNIVLKWDLSLNCSCDRLSRVMNSEAFFIFLCISVRHFC